MFTFNRKEQIALLLLCAALLVGGIVHIVERQTDLPDFEIKKAAVEIPEAPEVPAEARANPVSDDSTSVRIDLNQASSKDLTRLPGIGPKTAALIVKHREQNGQFRTVEDLASVRGIGPKTLARLRPLLTVQSP